MIEFWILQFSISFSSWKSKRGAHEAKEALNQVLTYNMTVNIQMSQITFSSCFVSFNCFRNIQIFRHKSPLPSIWPDRVLQELWMSCQESPHLIGMGWSTAEVPDNRHEVDVVEVGNWQTQWYQFYFQKPGVKQVRWMTKSDIHL